VLIREDAMKSGIFLEEGGRKKRPIERGEAWTRKCLISAFQRPAVPGEKKAPKNLGTTGLSVRPYRKAPILFILERHMVAIRRTPGLTL